MLLPGTTLWYDVFDDSQGWSHKLPFGFSTGAKRVSDQIGYKVDEVSRQSKCEITSAHFSRYAAGNQNVDITNISFGPQKKRREGFVVPTLTIENNGDWPITIKRIGCYKTAAQHIHAPNVFYIASTANKFYGDGPIPAGEEGIYEASFCYEYGPSDKYTITHASDGN